MIPECGLRWATHACTMPAGHMGDHLAIVDDAIESAFDEQAQRVRDRQVRTTWTGWRPGHSWREGGTRD